MKAIDMGKSSNQIDGLSIVIPTYQRDSVLTDTIQYLLPLVSQTSEILVIDQTLEHDQQTDQLLSDWDEQGIIRWIRLEKPSLPHAENIGFGQAIYKTVLFLDDDIIPSEQLLEAHLESHRNSDCWAVVGQVLQPWQKPDALQRPDHHKGVRQDIEFPFHSTIPANDLRNVMAGNLSVNREKALEIGGFDENFIGAAYRADTEFARRIVKAGGGISFNPDASIKHLRVASGGTRAQGEHRASADPKHGVGDYYYALRQGISLDTVGYMGYRMIREVCTKFHLKYPWYIPVKLLGEVRALLWAIQMNSSQSKSVQSFIGKKTSSSP